MAKLKQQVQKHVPHGQWRKDMLAEQRRLADALAAFSARFEVVGAVIIHDVADEAVALARVEHKLDGLTLPTQGRFMFHVVGLVPRAQRPGGKTMLEITLDTASKARVRVVPTSLTGKPATIEAGSLAVTPADGLTNPVATIESQDTFTVQADLPDGSVLTDADFTVSGDADLGAGVTTISDVVRLHVTTEQAANLGLTSVEVVPR